MHTVALFSNLGHWQIDLVAIGLLLTSTIFTFIPEEMLFVALGYLAHCGRINPFEAILAAKMGLIPADGLTVWLGKKMGSGILTRRPFRFLFNEQTMRHSFTKLKKSGNILLFFTRFTPMLRTPVYLAAGIAGFSIRRSILIDILAASIQIPLFFLVGYIFGERAGPYVSFFAWFMPCLALGGVLVKAAKPAVLAWSTK